MEKIVTRRKLFVSRLGVGDRTWMKVRSLGEMAIFLGDNISIDFHGCQLDCIYFVQGKDLYITTTLSLWGF